MFILLGALVAMSQSEPCVSHISANNCVHLDITESYDFQGKEFVFMWDMGDGTKLEGLEVNHCYGEPGLYLAVLSLIDPITKTEIDQEAEIKVVIKGEFDLQFSIPESTELNKAIEFNYELIYPENTYRVDSIAWQFDNEATSNEKNAVYTFKHSGRQMIDLFVRLVSEWDEVVVCAQEVVEITISDPSGGLLKKVMDGIPVGSRFLRDKVNYRILMNDGTQLREPTSASQFIAGANYTLLVFRGNRLFDGSPIPTGSDDSLEQIEQRIAKAAESMAETLPLELKPIFFDLDSEKLTRGNKNTLLENAEILKRFPEVKVAIGVFTNSQGSLERTVELARKRAELIKDFLVENGVDSDRLVMINPLANRTLLNNCLSQDCDPKLDRRADFKILNEFDL